MEGQPIQVLPLGAEKRLFSIRYCLGRGGFGEVYRASMTSSSGLETDVAIKILHTDLDSDTQAVQRLRDEGRMLGALIHPSIVRVYDLVILEGRVGLVTEYIDGQDLSKCIRGDYPLNPRGVVAVIGRVADALHAAWNTPSPSGEPLHLIHRDVKPQNIRISTNGGVKLLDFGVAHSSSISREAYTSTGHMVGSYLYMAPECLRSNEFSTASDVFALGLVLFESLARRRLFQNLSLREIYILVLNDEKLVEFIEERLSLLDLSPSLEHLLRDMLSIKPTQRPSTKEISARCDDLVDTLPGPSLRRWCKARSWPAENQVTGILDGRTITEATMATASSRSPRSSRNLTLLLGTTAGSFLLLLMVGGAVLILALGVLLFTNSSPPQPVRHTRNEHSPVSTYPLGPFTTPNRSETASSSPSPMPPATLRSRMNFTVLAGKAVLRIQRNGTSYYNKEHAPYGNYVLQVNWGKGFKSVRKIHVNGRTTRVECNALTHKCR